MADRVRRFFSIPPVVCLLLALLSWSPVAAALDFPALTGRVVDNANLLSPDLESRIEKQLEQHEAATSNQVVVVTLPSLQGASIEDYGYQLGRHWAIGQEERNNGVLLIVAPNQRKVRIEVGYGLEGDLPDAISKTIIEQEILPAFRNSDYPAGIIAGVDAILAAIGGSYEAQGVATARKSEIHPFAFLLLVVLIFIVVCLTEAYGGGGMGFGFGGRRDSDSGSSGFGGSSSSGGFSGGGGSFGGGGSSGDW